MITYKDNQQFLDDAIEYANNYIKRESLYDKAFEADVKYLDKIDFTDIIKNNNSLNMMIFTMQQKYGWNLFSNMDEDDIRQYIISRYKITFTEKVQVDWVVKNFDPN